jgi:hypothetical protein
MPEQKHTFILEPAHWRAHGEFTGRCGESARASGEAVISHGTRVWRKQGALRIAAETPLGIDDACEIVPFPHGRLWTCWTSHNPALGRLIGRFVLLRDAIVSTFESQDGAYTGSETLLQVAADAYRCRGILMRGGVLVSSWALELERTG